MLSVEKKLQKPSNTEDNLENMDERWMAEGWRGEKNSSEEEVAVGTARSPLLSLMATTKE